MRQLNGLDANFLTWEDATTVGHMTSVLLLDPSTSPEPWTFDRFAALLEARIHKLPSFTEKLVEVPLGLDFPYWVRAADFDLEDHLHHVAVPGGGGREPFADLVTRIHERPLDRRRPLWECHVVEQVAGDRIALITKIHHAAIDGLSGQEILASLVDLDPDAPLAPDDEDPTERGAAVGELDPAAVVGRTMLSLLASPGRAVKAGRALARLVPVVGPALGDPLDRAEPGGETAGDLARRLGAAPRTPFNAAIGPHRRWAYSTLPLDRVKAIKNEAGVTVNDVILATVAGTVRSWLDDRDALPDRPLAAMVPLSVRSQDQTSALGNFISATVTTLATNLDDAAERLAAVKASMDQAKERHATLPADILTDVTQVTPPAIAGLAARLVASTKLADRVNLPFNLVVSNVPGPPIPLYLAGARIVDHYPVSTIVDGVGLNVTVMSVENRLGFGYVADRDLIPDLWDLADRTEPALAELADAVGVAL
ncbi:MAG: wax ester/triacylglycerol synthase family O-acyltransferase [Actinomycetota bacterium]